MGKLHLLIYFVHYSCKDITRLNYMRRFSAIILLAGIFAMNMDMLCQSLCSSGHSDMVNGHASHKTTNHEEKYYLFKQYTNPVRESSGNTLLIFHIRI